MAPHWVENQRDYLHWVRDCVDQSGGEIQGPGLMWRSLVDGSGVTVGLSIPQHLLQLADERFLNFAIQVEITPPIIAELDYSFHYGDSENPYQWRACRSDNHVYVLGNRYHLHQPVVVQGFDGLFETVSVGHIDLDEAIAAMLERRLPAPQSNDDD